MKKVINITDIQNSKKVLLCLRFVYLLISHISLFRFLLLNDKNILLIAADIDSQFLSCRHSMHVSLQSAVVCQGLSWVKNVLRWWVIHTHITVYLSQILAMNFGSFTTRGHSPITWTFTPHSYRSLIDCISHHPLHQHSCSQ